MSKQKPAKKTKILIADDLGLSRGILRTMLLKLDYVNIDEAWPGRKAVARYTAGNPDVVFLDINMPDGNGIETLIKIKVLNPEAFVVMVSAESSYDNVRTAMETGANAFLVKPYQSGRIVEILEKYEAAAHG